MRRTTPAIGSIVLAAVLASHSGRAQSRSPQEFGTDEDAIVVIGSRSFRADGSNLTELIDPGLAAGGGGRNAPLEVLPNGSHITQITYYFHDEDPDGNLTFYFCNSSLNADTGASLIGHCEEGGSSDGVDGDSYVIDTTGYDIRYRQDQDDDGEDELYNYYLRAIVTPADALPFVRAVEIRWRRQVSPPPPDATFNDVPTDHPFFQFVEALADSGITAGCGAGNYCPDAPLTRGQMAVFLAKALGLHWPWDAP
jgi:hypothetical protein